MIPEPNEKPTIIRTERGLSISGTRITLYDIMDYLTEQYPPKFIASLFNLSSEQTNCALNYIEKNRAEVEREYQIVLKEADELRLFYEEENRELFEKIAKMQPKPRLEAALAQLQAQKAELQAKLKSQP